LARQFRFQPNATMTPDGQIRIPRRGAPSPLADPYHLLLSISWPTFFTITISLFLIVNCLFAQLYLLGGNCISNSRPGHFGDAFFFSVQTIGTVGYGVMAPTTDYAHIVVCLEVLTGLLGFAVITGLVFSRFARPTARVRFSQLALIANHNGIPTLMFRMANQRGSHILEAQITLVALLNEITQEGESLRRFYELPLIRHQSPVFGLTWLVFHSLTADSPIAAISPEWMQERNLTLLVTLTGVDETLVNNVHARHAYLPDHIVWGQRFEDVLIPNRHGQLYLDLHRFDLTRPDLTYTGLAAMGPTTMGG